jgi:hypothetical protein
MTRLHSQGFDFAAKQVADRINREDAEADTTAEEDPGEGR